ncbi:uncharacterized protein LOC132194782 [Neocloeon triangulifer]|uniref:uncharacterized protein LOC132194782 n=1 Tax=Neocloeon triangulifer TaxID=2078957 RepID=UPI00286F8771|nr:uncharacterized protein LOC132194782 [Neocloeon triangulifer]
MEYDGSDFAPKPSRHLMSSNQSVRSSSSRLSITNRKMSLNWRRTNEPEQNETQSMVEPPTLMPPQPKGLSVNRSSLNMPKKTNAIDAPATEKNNNGCKKSLFNNPQPGPSGLSLMNDANENKFSPAKRPRLKIRSINELKSPKSVLAILKEDDTEETKESKETVTTSTPSKSPKKRAAVKTPRKKTGPSPAKSNMTVSPMKSFDAKGFCKVCQLPLICIKISEWDHVKKCEVPIDSPECYDGKDCKSRVRTHYLDFRHTLLAKLRSDADESGSSIQVEIIRQAQASVSNPVVIQQEVAVDFRSVSTNSKRVSNDNPFLSDSDNESEPDLFAEYLTTGDRDESASVSRAKGQRKNSGVVRESVDFEEATDDSDEQEGVNKACSCDKDKISVTVKANGEMLNLLADENGWIGDENCDDCPGVKRTICKCSKSMILQIQDKETFFQKQKEAKEKWASIPIMTRQVSSDASSVSSFSSTSSTSSLETTTRKVPYWKLIKDTSFAVDAFNHGKIPLVKYYFLSHFHYDHYIGLTKHFTGIIYCSPITARLVIQQFKLRVNQIRTLQLDETIVVDKVKVTALDANHCPGSIMFLFQLLDGTNIVHTGDFRFSPNMESYPSFWNIEIHHLHLDTTYCNPMYDFDSQEEILQRVVSLAEEKHLKSGEKCLFVCGSYTIGKEKVFLEIAKNFNLKFFANTPKRRILKQLENSQILDLMAENPEEATIHVVPNGSISYTYLSNYLSQMNKKKQRFSELVAFRPTGWQHSAKRAEAYKEDKSGNITIIGIPYSEHSSFSELRRFVKFLKPKKIHPTVRSQGMAWDVIKNTCTQWVKDASSSVQATSRNKLQR